MKILLTNLIFAIGIGQLCVLIASSLVPLRLDWKSEFQKLSRLHAQLYFVYGGYVVMSIIALGLICIVNASEIATGSLLARSVCFYGLVFWGVRVSLQPFLEVKEHLTVWWLKAGYHTLTVLFLSFTVVYAWAAIFPP